LRIVITGGAGFVGSNLIRYLLDEHDGVEIVNLDLLTYAGNLENLAGVEEDPRYSFIRGDVCDSNQVRHAIEGADVVVHLAAESHVDRSIEDGSPFVHTNVIGTHTLLQAALDEGVGRFLQVSTDEVYGSLPWRDPEAMSTEDVLRAEERSERGEHFSFFTEETPVAPRSPYSASKAGADHLALAYHHTHGLPVIVTRSSNNYGPYQFPEKLIPLLITNALNGRRIPVYGDGLHVRDWLHVRDHCRGLEAAIRNGGSGEVYNLGGLAERTNLQVVNSVLATLGREADLIDFVADRPGHDRRYAIDIRKAEVELGWWPEISFEKGLAATIEWYLRNEKWWERARSGAYRTYYETMYGEGGRYAAGHEP